MNAWVWIGFHAAVVGMLALDLGFAGRRPDAPRNAGAWSALWVLVAPAFGVFVRIRLGGEAGVEYYTAYLLPRPGYPVR